MIKPNKTLFVFLGFTIILGFLFASFVKKLHPVIMQKGVYFCQEAFRTLSLKFPYQLQILFSLFLGFFLLLAMSKVISIFFHNYTVTKTLRFHTDIYPYLQKILISLSLERKVFLVKSNKSFAFCFGMRNPKIYVSTTLVNLMNKKEIEAILLHEKYHLENGDSFTMIIASIATYIFPFFPVLSDLLKQYKVQREINADKKALMYLGDSEPLISVLKKLLQMPSYSFIASASIADYETLEPRIFFLTGKENPRKQFSVIKILISFFSIIFMSLMLLTPVHAIQIQTKSTNTTMVCLQNSSCLQGCKEQQTSLPYSIIKIQNESRPYTPFLEN